MLLFVLVLDRSRVVHEIVSCSRYMRRVWKKRAKNLLPAAGKKKAGNPYSFCYVPVSLCLSDTGKGMTLEKKVALFCFPDEEGL